MTTKNPTNRRNPLFSTGLWFGIWENSHIRHALNVGREVAKTSRPTIICELSNLKSARFFCLLDFHWIQNNTPKTQNIRLNLDQIGYENGYKTGEAEASP
jgi:hypothetical protein